MSVQEKTAKTQSTANKATLPAQAQKRQPGIEKDMEPKPIAVHKHYKPAGKLKDKVVLITGGDSGIGRAVAYLCALEGAKVVIAYLNETQDAKETVATLKKHQTECFSIAADLSRPENCQKVVDQVVQRFGRIDCLINNAAEQHVQEEITDISIEQWDATFKTNIYAYFYLVKAATPHMTKGSTIINSTSVTAYRGSETLIDYSATKGAIVAFTRSLAKSLIKKGIRVNGVAPGPVWTPLIPASFPAERVAHFGEKLPVGEPAQPADIAPSYIFLACDDSNYFVGQILHPNGGEIVNA